MPTRSSVHQGLQQRKLRRLYAIRQQLAVISLGHKTGQLVRQWRYFSRSDPHCGEMFRLLGFEIQIQGNEWPIPAIVAQAATFA